MKIRDEHRHDDNEVHSIVVSAAVAVCFSVTLALVVLKLFRKLCFCCYDKKRTSFKKKSKVSDEPQNFHYEPLSTKSKHSSKYASSMSLSLENLASYKNTPFEIPGKTQVATVQPLDTPAATSGYAGSDDSEHPHERAFLDEYIQPTLNDTTDQSIVSEDGLNLGLYQDVRKTQCSGSLGKMLFSLQYEDNTKQKLLLKFNKLQNLLFTRFNENVIGVRLQAVLLPDRETRYNTQLLSRASQLDLEEKFTFHSKPHHRDFESRTVHIIVLFVDRSMKETIYGEARLPLLSHEIYSQVPTDIAIGIRPCPPQNEIGDIHMVLSYQPEQKKLTVVAKTVKFVNASLTDNLTSLHIKAHLTRLGGEKLGKKRSVSKTLSSNHKSRQSVDINDQMAFKLDMENFLLSTLKLNVHGKHRILGNHLSLGKIRLGENHRDEGGKVHWRLVINSEGIGWSMWHPIYSS